MLRSTASPLCQLSEQLQTCCEDEPPPLRSKNLSDPPAVLSTRHTISVQLADSIEYDWMSVKWNYSQFRYATTIGME